MKTLFIVANWKANKTQSEATEWLREFPIPNSQFPIPNKEVVICAPFMLLSYLKLYVLNHKFSFKIGAQDVSPFAEGAYTGEISAKQIKEFADYVIVGHSERRKYFLEDKNIINKKIEMSFKDNLIPILCISDIRQLRDSLSLLGSAKVIIAYEPLFAIGSRADTPENANAMADKIKKLTDGAPVLYGGGVTEKNVKNFTDMLFIDGVLVGEASLDPLSFSEIIKSSKLNE